jgi:hypothetical protein
MHGAHPWKRPWGRNGDMNSSKGNKSVIDMDLLGVRFLSLWCRDNETGLSLGVRWENHDVHYTVYSRREALNCHITDKGKRIWEREIPLDEMQTLAQRFMREIVGKWRAREKFYPIDPRRLETWEELSITDEKYQRVDFGEYIKRVIPMLLDVDEKPATIEDSMKQAPLFGLQKRRLQWYFILAEPNGIAVRFPLDPYKSPLRMFPTFEGMLRYMKYLDKKGFFDYITMSFDKEDMQRVFGEIELMVSNTEIARKRPLC